MITSAIDETAGSSGTETSEADFLILIQEFINITDLTSVKFTSLALSIIQAKVTQDTIESDSSNIPFLIPQVTLSEASVKSELTTSITTIEALGVTISEQLVEIQISFKELTGAEVVKIYKSWIEKLKVFFKGN